MAVHGKRILKALGIALGLLLCTAAFGQWDRDMLEFRGRLALSDGKYAQAIEQFNILAVVQPGMTCLAETDPIFRNRHDWAALVDKASA